MTRLHAEYKSSRLPNKDQCSCELECTHMEGRCGKACARQADTGPGPSRFCFKGVSMGITAHTMTLPGHSPKGLSRSLRLRSIAPHGIAI